MKVTIEPYKNGYTLVHADTALVLQEGLHRLHFNTTELARQYALENGMTVEVGSISDDEVLKLMEDRNLNIFQVIDVIIDANHLVGVGIVSLEDMIVKHIRSRAKKVNKTPKYPEALND